MFAADVGAGQAELVAQEVAEQQPRLDAAFVAGTVDGDGDRDQVRHDGTSLARLPGRPPLTASRKWVRRTGKGVGQGAAAEDLDEVAAVGDAGVDVAERVDVLLRGDLGGGGDGGGRGRFAEQGGGCLGGGGGAFADAEIDQAGVGAAAAGVDLDDGGDADDGVVAVAARKLVERPAAARGQGGDVDPDEHFVGFQGGGKQALVEVGGPNHALAL